MRVARRRVRPKSRIRGGQRHINRAKAACPSTPRSTSAARRRCGRWGPDIANRLPAAFGKSPGESQTRPSSPAETFDQPAFYAMQAGDIRYCGDESLRRIAIFDVYGPADDFQPIHRSKSIEHGS